MVVFSLAVPAFVVVVEARSSGSKVYFVVVDDVPSFRHDAGSDDVCRQVLDNQPPNGAGLPTRAWRELAQVLTLTG
jgi:hypothetical protein